MISPKRVGDYELLGELGRGGMGIVYLARQVNLDRPVPLEQLAAPHATEPAIIKRFVREARLADSPSHPNLVAVHEHVAHDGVPYGRVPLDREACCEAEARTSTVRSRMLSTHNSTAATTAGSCLVRLLTACGLVLAAWALAVASADASARRVSASPAWQDSPIMLVGSGHASAVLTAGQRRLQSTGRVALSLRATPEQFDSRVVEVADLNVAAFNVSQTALSGRRPRGKETGVVGFALSGPKVSLQYDPQRRTLSGRVPGRVDFPQLSELGGTASSANEDHFPGPTHPAQAQLDIVLDAPLDTARSGQGVLGVGGRARVTLIAAPLPRLRVPGFRVETEVLRLPLQYTRLATLEVARRLCVQPVSVRSSLTDPSPTGAGLAFGQPNANREWGKADLVLEYRPFRTVTSAGLKVVGSSDEEDDLRNTVEDDGCIEAFFVAAFSPSDAHGGGATWMSGTASAQIISSDENATFGIDRTHLAHELGHVVALAHPGDGTPSEARPLLTDGSPNTLMCQSGFRLDNPQRNSVANETNLKNPLIVFAFKGRTAGPDCRDDEDCGLCG